MEEEPVAYNFLNHKSIHMKFRNLISFIALAGVLTFIGCSPSDKSVEENVTKSLNNEPATTGLSVTVTDGVATISGEVANEDAKAKAGSIAEGVNGVKSVSNNITIMMDHSQHMPPPTDTTSVALPDTTLAP